MSKSKDEQLFDIALELASTGDYRDWREIENELRLKRNMPEARTALAPTDIKTIINQECAKSQRNRALKG